MSSAVLAAIQRDWPTPAGCPVSGLVVGLDRTYEAKVAVLLFDGRGRVCAVAKSARDPAGAQAVRAERAALLWAADLPALHGTVPHPLELHEAGPLPVLVQSARPGRPMTADYYSPGHTSSRARVAADFARAGAWLDAFVTATTYERAPVRSVVQNWVDPLCERYRDAFLLSLTERDLFAEVRARLLAADADGVTVPLAARHGDFWMGNLLVDGGAVTGVIDWELARRWDTAPPVLDAFKLATSYGLYLDRPYPWADGHVPGHSGRRAAVTRFREFGDWRNLGGFGHVWFGPGWLSELVRDWLRQRWDVAGVPAEVAGTLLPVFVAEQALTLTDPETRAGWHSAVRAFAAERSSCWAWTGEPA